MFFLIQFRCYLVDNRASLQENISCWLPWYPTLSHICFSINLLTSLLESTITPPEKRHRLLHIPWSDLGGKSWLVYVTSGNNRVNPEAIDALLSSFIECSQLQGHNILVLYRYLFYSRAFLNCSSIKGDLSVSIIDISSHLIKLYVETDAIVFSETPQIEMPSQYYYCQYIS